MKIILHTTQSRRDQVYKAIIGELERLEHRGVYRGNGHHLAQKLSAMVVDELFICVPDTNYPDYEIERNEVETTEEDRQQNELGGWCDAV